MGGGGGLGGKLGGGLLGTRGELGRGLGGGLVGGGSVGGGAGGGRSGNGGAPGLGGCATTTTSSVRTFATVRPARPDSATTPWRNSGSTTTFLTISAELGCTPQSTSTCAVVGVVSLRVMDTSRSSMKCGSISTTETLSTLRALSTLWMSGTLFMSKSTRSSVTRTAGAAGDGWWGGGECSGGGCGGGGCAERDALEASCIASTTETPAIAATPATRPSAYSSPCALRYHGVSSSAFKAAALNGTDDAAGKSYAVGPRSRLKGTRGKLGASETSLKLILPIWFCFGGLLRGLGSHDITSVSNPDTITYNRGINAALRKSAGARRDTRCSLWGARI